MTLLSRYLTFCPLWQVWGWCETPAGESWSCCYSLVVRPQLWAPHYSLDITSIQHQHLHPPHHHLHHQPGVVVGAGDVRARVVMLVVMMVPGVSWLVAPHYTDCNTAGNANSLDGKLRAAEKEFCIFSSTVLQSLNIIQLLTCHHGFIVFVSIGGGHPKLQLFNNC